MDAQCSFSELRKSKSGDFRGSPFAVRRLLEYKDDVTGHLQSCHLSKRCGQSADVKKYSNYFWVTIPIGSGKRVSFNNYKMSTPPQEAILPCFGALNVADFLFCS